jgi:hypothetical protein
MRGAACGLRRRLGRPTGPGHRRSLLEELWRRKLGKSHVGDESKAYAAKAGTPTMGGPFFHLPAPRGRTEAAVPCGRYY